MYFRKIITKKNDKQYRYLKLLENYREGSRTRHSVVASLGNLDHFTHQKFQALIGSLVRIAETELLRGVGNDQPDTMNEADFKKLRELWRQLKLPELISRIVPGLNDPEPSLLAEAMVIGLIARPNLDLAVEKYYRELPVPELVWQDLDGVPFYKLLEALGASRLMVEDHLNTVSHQLTGRKSDLLFVKLGSGEYEGSRCELSHHGQGYLVRPHKQPLLIALLINDSGWPLGFRILWRGSNTDQYMTQLLREVIQERDVSKYVAVFDQEFDPGDGLHDDSYNYIVVEKPKNLIHLPVSAFEMTHYESFFTRVQPDLWFKQVGAQSFSYIICYYPDQRNGEHLEQRLSSALIELNGVSKAIAENRLRRKKAVVGRVVEILNRHGCSEYVTYVYDNAAHVLEFEVKQAAIDEYKIIRDTLLIKSNLYFLPPDDIVRSCLTINSMDCIFRTVKDLTKIPWVPQLETSSVQKVIEGHVVIRMLAFLLDHLYSSQTTELRGGMCDNKV